ELGDRSSARRGLPVVLLGPLSRPRRGAAPGQDSATGVAAAGRGVEPDPVPFPASRSADDSRPDGVDQRRSLARRWLLGDPEAEPRPGRALVRVRLRGDDARSLSRSDEAPPGAALVRRRDPDRLSLGPRLVPLCARKLPCLLLRPE